MKLYQKAKMISQSRFKILSKTKQTLSKFPTNIKFCQCDEKSGHTGTGLNKVVIIFSPKDPVLVESE